MCLQCTVNAERIGLVLPSWWLMRSRGDDPRWPRGSWGLVRSNDPDFVWSTTPTPDPLHGIPDDRWEAWFEENPTGSSAYERTMAPVPDDFRNGLICEPELGWQIVRDSIPFGYDPEEGGDFASWLFSLIGMRLRDGFLDESSTVVSSEGIPDHE